MKFSAALEHALGLAAAVALTLVLLYVSRFWVWTPWDSGGLFGAKWLSPYGDLVRFHLGDTQLADFHWLVWGCGGILVLSLIHWLVAKVLR